MINILIITLLSANMFGSKWLETLFFALVIYFISLTIALSPIGEWILRLQTGCKKIKRKEYRDFIYPIFEEVYAKAIEKNNIYLMM